MRNDNSASAPVCVLGPAAKDSLFGVACSRGIVKLNELWCNVIGIAGPQLAPQSEVSGVANGGHDNLIYAPLNSVLYREDSQSWMKDEVDGLYLHLASTDTSATDAEVVRGIFTECCASQRGDFSVIIPAELLAQQKRNRGLFNTVMVAIASISLLVGGIGIMKHHAGGR